MDKYWPETVRTQSGEKQIGGIVVGWAVIYCYPCLFVASFRSNLPNIQNDEQMKTIATIKTIKTAPQRTFSLRESFLDEIFLMYFASDMLIEQTLIQMKQSNVVD